MTRTPAMARVGDGDGKLRGLMRGVSLRVRAAVEPVFLLPGTNWKPAKGMELLMEPLSSAREMQAPASERLSSAYTIMRGALAAQLHKGSSLVHRLSKKCILPAESPLRDAARQCDLPVLTYCSHTSATSPPQSELVTAASILPCQGQQSPATPSICIHTQSTPAISLMVFRVRDSYRDANRCLP